MSFDPTASAYFVKLVEGGGRTRYIPISRIDAITKITDTHWEVHVGDNIFVTSQNVQTFIDTLGVFNP